MLTVLLNLACLREHDLAPHANTASGGTWPQITLPTAFVCRRALALASFAAGLRASSAGAYTLSIVGPGQDPEKLMQEEIAAKRQELAGQDLQILLGEYTSSLKEISRSLKEKGDPYELIKVIEEIFPKLADVIGLLRVDYPGARIQEIVKSVSLVMGDFQLGAYGVLRFRPERVVWKAGDRMFLTLIRYLEVLKTALDIPVEEQGNAAKDPSAQIYAQGSPIVPKPWTGRRKAKDS